MKERVFTRWAAQHFDACLARIRNGGAGFVLYEDQTPIAELTPLADRRRGHVTRTRGALAGVPVDEDFASDLQSVNAADQPLDNPWESSATPRH